jgi:hypothetical protein
MITPTAAGDLQRAGIEFHREVFKIRPVTLHRLPAWFAHRVCWATSGWGRSACWRGMQTLARDLPVQLFDHWGSSVTEDGRSAFTTEPYLNAADPHVHAAAAELARRLGVEYRILPAWESWWNPGSTIRIEFRESPGEPPCPGCCSGHESARRGSVPQTRKVTAH